MFADMVKQFFKYICFACFLAMIGCGGSTFLEKHWKFPLEEQGPPPKHFTALEKELGANACGNCHQKQFQTWSASLHSKSVGGGLRWQMPSLGKEKAKDCLSCHSPLMETKQLVLMQEGLETMYPESWKTVFLPGKEQNLGIQCASCHVRKNIRYGPPPTKQKIDNNSLPHNGFKAQVEFESSLFCKSCHESPESSMRINGKAMMETFSEWESSHFAKQGITCQNCHMPSRNHEWKGIHDPSYVRSGIETKFFVKQNQEGLLLEGSLTSMAIGHKFPSYAVPKIYLKLYHLRRNGSKKLLEEQLIGRLTDIFLTKEFSDTRLEPGETIKIRYQLKREEYQKGDQFEFLIKVSPDELYIRMFEHNLQNANQLGHSETVQRTLRDSLVEKQNSDYILTSLIEPVPDQPRQ
ncbi:cytochrome c554 and C-prime [Leptospira ryugenii]|uniref:Cytochrome c554 and C-prime n=1 Tax=Leptospira ryugenii TaxID=1917863 RepID=A0A2P2E1E3_9LEPT|nr:multiheme c-type cytochrome [Leptospira ryugenii]GBF50684.1 cytochrome c554 and C-prime [Leptospira ryugenii]